MRRTKLISTRIAIGVAAICICLPAGRGTARADYPDGDSDSVGLHKRLEFLTATQELLPQMPTDEHR
jgi:hypothetical protein